MTITSTAPTTDHHPGRASRPVLGTWDAITLPSPRNAAIAIAVAAICATIVGVVSLLGAPTYESRATLAISQPRALAESQDVGVLDKLDRLRLKYAALARTLPITQPVAERIGVSTDDVRDDMHVAVGGESLLMFPTARAGAEDEARQGAQVLAEEIVRYADREQARAGIPAVERYEFTVIEPAQEGDKVAPTSRTAIGAAFFAALVAGGAAYVVLQLRSGRDRLR